MNWLARLKNSEIPPAGDATETTKRVSVVFVAPSHGHIQKIEGADATPANDAALDPDRDCWPHSAAMNGAEIDTFTARLARFTDRGLSLSDAEALADKLVIRDRDGDDRRTCLECANLSRRCCGQWRQAGIGGPVVAGDLVAVLQRCAGFIAPFQKNPMEATP
jgi:hypothetical protein